MGTLAVGVGAAWPLLPHPLYIYRGYADRVNVVAWSPDDTHIASAGDDGTVQVWDASDGGHAYTYKGHLAYGAFNQVDASVYALSWSPDGKYIASGAGGNDDSVQIWDAANGHLAQKVSQAEIVSWSPDGMQIAMISTASSFDVSKAVFKYDIVVSDMTRHFYTLENSSDTGASTFAWSPEGRHLAVACFDGTVHIWDVVARKLLSIYRGHTESVNTIAWSPDGKLIASSSYSRIAPTSDEKTVQVWDAATSKHIITYSGHSDNVWAVAWSPDSKRIVSGSKDQTAQVWEVAGGKLVSTYRGYLFSAVSAVAWSHDGSRIASGGTDHTVQVWNAP